MFEFGAALVRPDDGVAERQIHRFVPSLGPSHQVTVDLVSQVFWKIKRTRDSQGACACPRRVGGAGGISPYYFVGLICFPHYLVRPGTGYSFVISLNFASSVLLYTSSFTRASHLGRTSCSSDRIVSRNSFSSGREFFAQSLTGAKFAVSSDEVCHLVFFRFFCLKVLTLIRFLRSTAPSASRCRSSIIFSDGSVARSPKPRISACL
jgi:hypothetical protein